MFALRVFFSVVLLHHYCCAFLPITEPVDYSSSTEFPFPGITNITDIPADIKEAVENSMGKGFFIADQLSAQLEIVAIGSELYILTLIMTSIDNDNFYSEKCDFRVRKVSSSPYAKPVIEKKNCIELIE